MNRCIFCIITYYTKYIYIFVKFKIYNYFNFKFKFKYPNLDITNTSIRKI